MSKLDQVAYIIEDGRVVESAIRDLGGYIDETTTPKGIAPRYHVRGNELWSWGVGGSNPHMIRAYDSEGEAQEALEETFVHDFWSCSDIMAFSTREQAEKFLRDGVA